MTKLQTLARSTNRYFLVLLGYWLAVIVGILLFAVVLLRPMHHMMERFYE